MTQEMQTLSLTQEDINLITYALRKLSEQTAFFTIKDDAANLLEYIKKESTNNQP